MADEQHQLRAAHLQICQLRAELALAELERDRALHELELTGRERDFHAQTLGDLAEILGPAS